MEYELLPVVSPLDLALEYTVFSLYSTHDDVEYITLSQTTVRLGYSYI